MPVIIGRGAGVSSVFEQEKIGRVIDVPANPVKIAEIIEETAMCEKVSGKFDEEWH